MLMNKAFLLMLCIGVNGFSHREKADAFKSAYNHPSAHHEYCQGIFKPEWQEICPVLCEEVG